MKKVRPLKYIKAKHLDKAYKEIVASRSRYTDINSLRNTCTLGELSFNENSLSENVHVLINLVDERESKDRVTKYNGAVICNVIDESYNADYITFLHLLGFKSTFKYTGQEGIVSVFLATVKDIKDHLYNNQNEIKKICADSQDI